MQTPTTRVSVRLNSIHHKMLKELAGVYGSQQKAIEHALENAPLDGIHDHKFLGTRNKLLTHPRICILDRDILDAIIAKDSDGVASLLTGVLTAFIAGKSLEEASVGEILKAMQELFAASNLFEGVSLDFEERTGTYLIAFHYDNSSEYLQTLFVEPLRYIFSSKGVELSVKLSPQYGYVIVHEPRLEEGSGDT
jgi:hypothetical protein